MKRRCCSRSWTYACARRSTWKGGNVTSGEAMRAMVVANCISPWMGKKKKISQTITISTWKINKHSRHSHPTTSSTSPLSSSYTLPIPFFQTFPLSPSSLSPVLTPLWKRFHRDRFRWVPQRRRRLLPILYPPAALPPHPTQSHAPPDLSSPLLGNFWSHSAQRPGGGYFASSYSRGLCPMWRWWKSWYRW